MKRKMNVVEEIRRDLQELKKIGVRVPAKVFTYVDKNPKEIEELYEDGMTLTEIADFVKQLA